MVSAPLSILYMKVGTHARESLSDIIARKSKEIADEGLAMWGYGGNTCHPTTMVQPFAKAATGPVVLKMQPMNSNHFAEPLRAQEFSVNGVHWKPVPLGINVLGSRYALCIDRLEEVDEELDLASTSVALGNSRGRPGNKYVQGRVDKACLEVDAVPLAEPPVLRRIRLQAQVIDPFAVFVR